MKALLIICIVLFCAQEAISDGLRVKRDDAKEKQEFVKLLNEYREEVGKIANIEMKPLTYNFFLEKKFADYSSDCKTWRFIGNYRTAPIAMNDNGFKFYQTLLTLVVDPSLGGKLPRRTTQQVLNRGEFMLLEFFNPAQTTIGCAKVSCENVFEDDPITAAAGVASRTVSFHGVCALGNGRYFPEGPALNIVNSQAATDKMKEFFQVQKLVQ